MEPSAFDIFILTPANAPDLIRRARAGSPAARGTIQLVNNFLEQPDNLCVNTDCEVEFRGGVVPFVFVIAMPFARDKGCAIVSGICPLCAHCAFDGYDLDGYK